MDNLFNKIARIILGLPFITITWLFSRLMLGSLWFIICFENWTIKGSFSDDSKFFSELPISPYKFIKEVWK